ncbi:MAG: spermidine/putrescine ABC transporter permease PotC [Coxiellaceae bacterium]|jgi:spermidine/putrescine transport system permease protein|nr:spermidine/putrescine ABC transporter permease PotC [Coxiellaceae bacterium]
MNKYGKYLYIIGVYTFLYLPIVTVIIFSFNNAKHSLVWQEFTFKWYAVLFHDSTLIRAVWHSLVLGILAATNATIIGTIISVSLFRYRFFGKKILHAIIFILILTPEIVTAVSLLILYSFIKIPLGFWTLLFAHTTLCIPFVAMTVYSRITTLDTIIFEAAMDLDATDFTIFRKIIIPLLLPAIAAAWLLSFTLSLDDVIISYFVSGPTFDILPLKIYSMVRLGVKPEVNALCTLMLAFTLLGTIASYQIIFKKKPA